VEPERFIVDFATADDAAIDAATTLLEDAPRTLGEIRAAALRYRVRAWVFRGDELVDVVIPEDERECSARYADVTAP
jgi:hypothetical protein